jgi:hypothetical protein
MSMPSLSTPRRSERIKKYANPPSTMHDQSHNLSFVMPTADRAVVAMQPRTRAATTTTKKTTSKTGTRINRQRAVTDTGPTRFQTTKKKHLVGPHSRIEMKQESRQKQLEEEEEDERLNKKNSKYHKVIISEARYGKGLFARSTIKKGEIVVGTTNQVKVIRLKRGLDLDTQHQQLEEKAKKLGLRYDQILLTNKNLFHFEYAKQPTWMYLNHSHKYANVHLALRKRRRKPGSAPVVVGVDFLSLRDIKPGEELLFDYGEPDPTWSDTRPLPLSFYQQSSTSQDRKRKDLVLEEEGRNDGKKKYDKDGGTKGKA